MTICQICGDEGYVKLLTHCVQCQNVAAHRYCVLNPSIIEETIKWSCEFCDPGKTKPTTPGRKGQDLNSTVQQAVQRKTDQENLEDNLCLSESEKPNNGQKEIPKETTDIFILDQNNKDNSSKRKHVKPSDDVKKEKINYDSGIKDSCQTVQVKEQSVTNVSQSNTNGQRQLNLGTIVCALLAKEDDVIMGGTKLVRRQNVTRSLLPKKGDRAANLDKSLCKVYSKQMELNNSQPDAELAYPAEGRKSEVEETIAEFVKRKQAKQLVGVKKIKQSNYDNGVEKGGSEVGQVKEKNTKNVSLSITNGHQQVNKEKNVGPVLSKVEDAVTESTRKAGHSIQGGTNLVNQQKPTKRLVAKKRDGETTFDKSSSEFSSKQMEELHINKSQSDAKLVDHAEDSKSEGKEITAKFVKRKQVKPLVDVKKVNKQSNYDNGVKKGIFEAHEVKEQSVKNVSLSDTNGHRQVNLGKNVGLLLTKVKDNVITESTCKAGPCMQGRTKLREHKKPTSGLAPKKGGGASSLEKSSCEVSPKQMKEVHMNGSQPDAEESDYANNKKSKFKEITAEFVLKRQAPRKKRKFIIEMEYSDEDPVFVVAKHSQLVSHIGQDHLSKSTSETLSKLSDDGLAQLSSIDSVPPRPSLMMADERGLTLESSVVFDNRIPVETQNLIHHVPALPLNEVAWSGYCSITNNEYPMSLALGAHLSNKAHENVKGAVYALPESLEFYSVPKTYAWPKSFENSPPTADVIGLYFFPIDDRSEKLYDYLVDKMIEDSLVLKVLLNYVELLVFCSLELPPEERSLRRKYYLWGVFKARKDYAIPNNQSNVHISKKDSIYKQEDRSTRSFSETHFPREALAKSVESTLPITESPYPAHNNSSGTFSNNHFHQEAVVESLELTRPYMESLYEYDDKQGKDTHDGDPRIFRKPQDHERCNRSEYRKYAERNHKYRKNGNRWNQGSRKRKDRDWRSSRYRSKR